MFLKNPPILAQPGSSPQALLWARLIFYLGPQGGGHLVVGTRMHNPDRVPFWPLKLTNGPFFLFENWFRYILRFCKMLRFLSIFPLVYLQKLCILIYMVNSTHWFKKSALQETSGLADVGCKFASSLVY